MYALFVHVSTLSAYLLGQAQGLLEDTFGIPQAAVEGLNRCAVLLMINQVKMNTTHDRAGTITRTSIPCRTGHARQHILLASVVHVQWCRMLR